MTRRRISNALLSLFGIGLIACASQPQREAANLPGRDACFWTRSLEDWTVLNDSSLIVHAPLQQDAYLIRLFAPISGLQFHERLGFEGGDGDPGQICGTNAYLIAGGLMPQRESIVAVRALTPTQAKRLLSSSGATKPHRQAADSQEVQTK